MKRSRLMILAVVALLAAVSDGFAANGNGAVTDVGDGRFWVTPDGGSQFPYAAQSIVPIPGGFPQIGTRVQFHYGMIQGFLNSKTQGIIVDQIIQPNPPPAPAPAPAPKPAPAPAPPQPAATTGIIHRYDATKGTGTVHITNGGVLVPFTVDPKVKTPLKVGMTVTFEVSAVTITDVSK